MQCPEAFIPPRTPLLNEYSPLPPRYARQSPANTWLPVAPPLPRSTVHAFCLFVIFITLRQATSLFKKLPRCSLFLTPRTAHLSDSSGMYCHSENINILSCSYVYSTVQMGATFILSVCNIWLILRTMHYQYMTAKSN